MSRTYEDPAGGSPSDIGTQYRTDKYAKRALIEARKEQYFMPLSGTVNMPKHMGKKIKKYHYIPLLDDENINDQGLDAAGATILVTGFDVQSPALVNAPRYVEAAQASWVNAYADNTFVWVVDGDEWVETSAATAVGYDSTTTGGSTGDVRADSVVKALLETAPKK